MTAATLRFMRTNVRTKILILVLTLALASLLITGFFAFSAINNIGKFSQASSQNLGKEAITNSSSALQKMGEEYLLRVATDQAEITDVLFKDTNSEMEILAANAATILNNSPAIPLTQSFALIDRPKDPKDGTLVYLSPAATATVDSLESQKLAGLDDSLKAIYQSDEEMTSVYVATDSGLMRIYPWEDQLAPGYDPRIRDWFTRAKTSGRITWSDKPYVDSSGKGLMMTCSRAIYSREYGTWVIGSDISVATINADFLQQTLGGSGYAVLINRDGDIISRPGMTAGDITAGAPFVGENAYRDKNPGLDAIVHNMTAGKTGIDRVWFGSDEVYIAYAPVTSMNWSLGISMPVSSITDPVEKLGSQLAGATETASGRIDAETSRFMMIFAVLLMVIVLAVLYVSFLLARVITRPIESLKAGTEALGNGNLDYRVIIRSGDEFEDLGNAFNIMAEDLRKNLLTLQKTTAEKERYAKEMEIAKDIQAGFLPEKIPEIPGFDIAAATIPAMEVGGDFYDFVPLTDGRMAFVIADVSGKGVSAALFMAMSKTILHAGLESQPDLPLALQAANRTITEWSRSCMFVTLFAAALDPRRMTLTGINAGHNPPLVIRGDTGEAFFLAEHGMAIGIKPDMNTDGETRELRPGDCVIFYTDGVTEAFNEQFEGFGEDRFIRAVVKCREKTARHILESIIEEVQRFAGNAPQSDDITLIVLRVATDS